MSRSGRGGRRGGILKGATWEHDASIKLESKPSDLFPVGFPDTVASTSVLTISQPHPNLKRPAPLSDKEKRQIKHYKNLQDQFHRSPIYTQSTKRDPDSKAKTFSEDQVNRQYGGNRKADMNPFLGVETHSMRQAPKKNLLPRLSERPFSM